MPGSLSQAFRKSLHQLIGPFDLVDYAKKQLVPLPQGSQPLTNEAAEGGGRIHRQQPLFLERFSTGSGVQLIGVVRFPKLDSGAEFVEASFCPKNRIRTVTPVRFESCLPDRASNH